MYAVYVDESGDVGSKPGSSRYFALNGFVVHELRWHDTLNSIIDFRERARVKYGLKLREEIHASHFVHKPGDLARIAKSIRLRLLRDVIDFQASLPDVSILNVVVDKNGKPADYDVFQFAWRALINASRTRSRIGTSPHRSMRRNPDSWWLTKRRSPSSGISLGRCAATDSFPSRPWSKTLFTGIRCTRTSCSYRM